MAWAAIMAAMGMGGGKGKPSGQQLKHSTKYNKSFKKMNFQPAKNMFDKFRSMINTFGVFAEFIKPFLDLMDVFDSALIKAFQEEITNLNKWAADGIPIMKKAAKAIHAVTDMMRGKGIPEILERFGVGGNYAEWTWGTPSTNPVSPISIGGIL
jgi:hypothetical protein